jgi:hypothetical protein
MCYVLVHLVDRYVDIFISISKFKFNSLNYSIAFNNNNHQWDSPKRVRGCRRSIPRLMGSPHTWDALWLSRRAAGSRCPSTSPTASKWPCCPCGIGLDEDPTTWCSSWRPWRPSNTLLISLVDHDRNNQVRIWWSATLTTLHFEEIVIE